MPRRSSPWDMERDSITEPTLPTGIAVGGGVLHTAEVWIQALQRAVVDDKVAAKRLSSWL